MTTTLNLQELYETGVLVNGSKEGFRPQWFRQQTEERKDKASGQ